MALGRERADLESVVGGLSSATREIGDLTELADLAETEKDAPTLDEVAGDIRALERRIATLEFQRVFGGRHDGGDAVVEIQAGAGGTEAQEWAQMLLRMYLRWGLKRGFATDVLAVSPGGVAGIKSAEVQFGGDHAYGWLRTESGVHRLVRKSPFDSTDRRQSSFASVLVAPIVDETDEVSIDPNDVREDTYRASGPGGQHVNRRDSAVRLTHLPTGTVAQCQSERSQHQNRKIAQDRLRAKMAAIEERRRHADERAVAKSQPDINRGNQIRSYVLDQSRVRDIRTNMERRDPETVLDGDLDSFMEANLRASA